MRHKLRKAKQHRTVEGRPRARGPQTAMGDGTTHAAHESKHTQGMETMQHMLRNISSSRNAFRSAGKCTVQEADSERDI